MSSTATRSCLNQILRTTEIPYLPREMPREGDDEAPAGSAAAPGKKRKRGSGGGAGSSKSRLWKGHLPVSIDSGSSPEAAPAPPIASRSAARRPPTPGPRSVLIHIPLSEPLPSSKKKAGKKPRVEVGGGVATPGQGIGCCFNAVLFQILCCRLLTHLYLTENPGVPDQPVSSEAAGEE